MVVKRGAGYRISLSPGSDVHARLNYYTQQQQQQRLLYTLAAETSAQCWLLG